MPIQNRRGRGITAAPNVAFASGELYPNGVDVSPANPDLQATVRPVGWMFRSTPGYQGVRVGNHKLDLAHPSGTSIHFTPLRLAENITTAGDPSIQTMNTPGDYADVSDVPGSEYLDGEGKLPAWAAESNAGPYLTDPAGTPPGDVVRHGGNVPRDMGARDQVTRELTTRAFYDRLAVNPNVVLRETWQQDPVITTIWAVIVVGGLSMLAHNIERSFRGRGGGRGVVAAVSTAPAAATSGTGASVAATTRAANTALTEAGAAVETAVSAAGDAVQAAGSAVEKTTEAAADATK